MFTLFWSHFKILKVFEIFDIFENLAENLGWPKGGSEVVENFFSFFYSKDIQNREGVYPLKFF